MESITDFTNKAICVCKVWGNEEIMWKKGGILGNLRGILRKLLESAGKIVEK